ncbi:TPA: hypothetical protein RRU48_005038 [Klebsiella pneumoniae]|nr:hypothetical protein [Klebsiella pneumoniae]
MTTNITILVQRLKVAAKNGCCHTLFPDDCLALVEALEKAQQRIASQREYYEGVIADGGKRIAELESRTVKMPEPFKLAKSSSGLTYYYADEVDAALTDAGIKVEAE